MSLFMIWSLFTYEKPNCAFQGFCDGLEENKYNVMNGAYDPSAANIADGHMQAQCLPLKGEHPCGLQS